MGCPVATGARGSGCGVGQLRNGLAGREPFARSERAIGEARLASAPVRWTRVRGSWGASWANS